MSVESDISRCVEVLRSGGVILHRTDTIWGIAASLHSESGYNEIYNIKQRDPKKPLILLVSDETMLSTYVCNIHPRIDNLHRYYSRPLTVVYPDTCRLPSYALSDDGSVAIRIAKDIHSQSIIEELGCPIFSTSANTAGRDFPESYTEIEPTVVESVDYVSTHRRTDTSDSQPSVLISYTDEGEIIFLRS